MLKNMKGTLTLNILCSEFFHTIKGKKTLCSFSGPVRIKESNDAVTLATGEEELRIFRANYSRRLVNEGETINAVE